MRLSCPAYRHSSYNVGVNDFHKFFPFSESVTIPMDDFHLLDNGAFAALSTYNMRTSRDGLIHRKSHCSSNQSTTFNKFRHSFPSTNQSTPFNRLGHLLPNRRNFICRLNFDLPFLISASMIFDFRLASFSGETSLPFRRLDMIANCPLPREILSDDEAHDPIVNGEGNHRHHVIITTPTCLFRALLHHESPCFQYHSAK